MAQIIIDLPAKNITELKTIAGIPPESAVRRIVGLYLKKTLHPIRFELTGHEASELEKKMDKELEADEMFGEDETIV